ncbi:uncharacterized protein EAE98_010139 [Botrytis deweyae]|uniref:BTB domain-containing protein n=1 Tax=Botrytis deweyae TaxID=2478750 RepID=A0ABQ7IA68_9HELO|nr:uncharacterized protein EAE98_010139 [Botrytis deweyae]KAF7917723.1 hypothetical protein EAE98_010139 [Botrytis deweyae]
MSALQPFLKGQLNAFGSDSRVIASKLSTIVSDSTDDHQSAIEEVIAAGDLPLSIVELLQFIKSLIRYSNDDTTLCGWLLNQLNEDPSIYNLASLLFPKAQFEIGLGARQRPSTITIESLEDFRSNFYNNESLEVIIVLLKAGKFSVSKACAVTAQKILRVMLSKSLDLEAPHLHNVVSAEIEKNGFTLLASDFSAALTLIKSIKALLRLVEDPEDVPLLERENYHSVRDISLKNKVEFSTQMQRAGMKEENTLKVHDCAERVDCWNEHLWLALMEHRRQDFVPIEPHSGRKITAANSSGRPPNNLTDIFRLEDVSCEECCSVTSLSAYFADLLLLLQKTPLPNASKESVELTLKNDILAAAPQDKSPTKSEPKNLLEVLSLRRPDLEKLELSCANSRTLIPYISSVTEVLESYIRFHISGKGEVIQAYQTPETVESDADNGHGPVYRPGNIDFGIYRTKIEAQMYPFSCFPYDYSRDLLLETFRSWGLFKFSHFIRTFQSLDSILSNLPVQLRTNMDLIERLQVAAQEVLDRQYAAEILRLSLSDFSAITGQTFYPRILADTLNGLPKTKSLKIDAVANWEISMLWGYDSNKIMLSMDKGLTNIKRKFMQRSGLEFKDVLELVKTQFFGQHLVITNLKGSETFDNSLEELRLLCNASNPPFKPLTKKLAFSIQSFLRLQAKLKWSTRDLDAAIFRFHSIEMEKSASTNRNAELLSEDSTDEEDDDDEDDLDDAQPSKNKKNKGTTKGELKRALPKMMSISPYVLRCIAALTELSEITALPPAALLPLWGEMDTYGKQSFFQRQFMLKPLQNLDSVFALSKDGEGKPHFFRADGQPTSVEGHIRGICESLKWPADHFDKLLKVTNLENEDLDITSFSLLYRYVTICKILSVPAKDCVVFFQAFFRDGRDAVLSSPWNTLEAVQGWKALLKEGWPIDSLVLVLGQVDAHNEKKLLKAGLSLYTSISDVSNELDKTLSYVHTTSSLNVENVIDCATRLFGSEMASSIVEYVDDSTELSELLIKRSPLIQELISVLKKAQSAIDAIEIPQKAASPDNSGEAQTVTEEKAETGKDTMIQDATLLSQEEEAQTKAAIQCRMRRSAFVEFAGPLIIQSSLQTAIVDIIKDRFPDLDLPTTTTLLSDIIKTKGTDGNSIETAMSVFEHLNDPIAETASVQPLDIYFCPGTTDEFTFQYFEPAIEEAKAPASPKNVERHKQLKIDDIEIEFDSLSKSWKTPRLTSGQYYLLQSQNISPANLSWYTAKSIKPTKLLGSKVALATTIEKAASLAAAIGRTTKICEVHELEAEELKYMAQSARETNQNLAMDLNAPRLVDLIRLCRYAKVKKAATKSKVSLVSMFTWLASTKDADVNIIAAKIAESTGWGVKRVVDLLAARFPTYSGSAILESLREYDSFLKLHEIITLDDTIRYGHSDAQAPTMAMLFDLARPRITISTTEQDFEKSNILHGTLSTSAKAEVDERMAPRRRDVLVQYLLQQSYIRKDLEIYDADGLFEQFLVDVQMGPQLRTSRIKQAISVIQLFIQRCLLGLEKGVPKSLLGREKWDWMQSYTLWEAHRKMFLYPENWIHPTLRDDKSQLFEQLEANLMQKDMSLNTFTNSILTYVISLNEIASLDVISYLHEWHEESEEIFHLFGRTRVSPHTFYYRSLTLLNENNDIFWRPWTKIEMDIPSVEMEWDGKRLAEGGAYLLPVLRDGRLYLFIPQLTPKATPRERTAEEKASKFESMRTQTVGTADPQRTWEVSMGWTELVNGNWRPKRVSPGSFELKHEAENFKLPSSSQFRIDPIFLSDRLQLVVSYAETKTSLGSLIAGTFEFCCDQITVLDGVTHPTPPKHDYPTYFNKVSGDGAAVVNMASDNATNGTSSTGQSPPIWVPKDVNENQKNIKWTLSRTHRQTIGLALDVKKSNGSSISYFNVPQKPLRGAKWSMEDLKYKMQLATIDHTFSQDLMRAAVDKVDPLSRIFAIMSRLDAINNSFGQIGGYTFYHELGQPAALYNWELGVHAIMLAVDRFASTHQFDEALQVARLLFDPTVDIEVGSKLPNETETQKNKQQNNQQQEEEQQYSCWRFPPFQDMSQHFSTDGEENFNFESLAIELQLAIKERRSHGQLVHATARGRPSAYMKWIVMKYAEILIAAGDLYFRQGTLESLPLATQRYIEAAHVLGPEPPQVPKLGKRIGKTFSEIMAEETKFDQAKYTLESPFSPELELGDKGSASTSEKDPTKCNIACFIKTRYFCIPINPKFKHMRALVHQRLFNTRNSLDIDGNPVIYALREPPIDPVSLVATGNQEFGISETLRMVSGDRDGPLPRQRFEALLSRALDLCSELRSLADRFISAVEKKDSEEYNQLHARHTSSIQAKMLEMKTMQLGEAQQNIEALIINRKNLESQLAFYLALTGDNDTVKVPTPQEDWKDIKQSIGSVTQDNVRMSPYEMLEMNLATIATGLDIVAATTDMIAQPFAALPTISVNAAPLGVGASISAGGSNIAAGIQSASHIFRVSGMIVQEGASRSGRMAQMTRQLQERRLQANMRGREIKGIDKQIEMAEIRVKVAMKDIEIQKSEMNEATKMDAWYRTKYSNKELYGWIEKSLRALHFQAYTLTMTIARKAETALSFEQGRKVSILKPAGYWQAAQDGLLSADHLYLDLKRLEAAYHDGPQPDFNITKTVSLRQIDPLALLKLRYTGSTTFSVSELQYDMDFPGHYMRRIRSVAVSIPAVLSPYSSINATLTLTTHKYRLSNLSSNTASYRDTSSSSDTFCTRRIPISSVAISSGSQDSGVFDLNFNGPRFMPFEGAGAISSWKLDLPTEVRKFDYETISDVLLHVHYTSYDGGAELRNAANEYVRQQVGLVQSEGQNEGFWTLFDLKNDFVNGWHGFTSQILGASKKREDISALADTGTGSNTAVVATTVATKTATSTPIGFLELGNLKERLPFWSRRQPKLQVRKVGLMSRSAKLVKGLTISPVAALAESWQDQKPDVGKNSMRMRTGLAEDSLQGWVLKASGAVLGDKETTVENVYMLIQYVFQP